MQVGATIGPYQVQSRLGAGGFASVWQAARSDGRPVALKIMHPKFLGIYEATGPSAEERFVEEFRILERVRSAGLVRVYELIDQRADGILAYAMELLEGRDLAGLRTHLSLEATLEAFILVAETLSDLHAYGVIHRDVKLSNIVVCDPAPNSAVPIIKLIDLGVAKDLMAESALKSTAIGSFVGTLSTMAPETFRRLNGEDVPQTDAIDQWSFGIAFYQALCGRPPFQAKTLMELISQIQFSSAPPVALRTELEPAVDVARLDQIVRRMLAKAPADRYASMRVVSSALRAAADELRRAATEPQFLELLRGAGGQPEAFVGDGQETLVGGALARILAGARSAASTPREGTAAEWDLEDDTETERRVAIEDVTLASRTRPSRISVGRAPSHLARNPRPRVTYPAERVPRPDSFDAESDRGASGLTTERPFLPHRPESAETRPPPDPAEPAARRRNLVRSLTSAWFVQDPTLEPSEQRTHLPIQRMLIWLALTVTASFGLGALVRALL